MKEQEKVGWGWTKDSTYWKGTWTRYKITAADFREMWGRQDGRCGGCEVEFAHPTQRELRVGVKPEIDHDHATAVTKEGYDKQEVKKEDVRGLLCRRCNDFLGKLNDNRDNLQKMLAYLDAHKERYGNR